MKKLNGLLRIYQIWPLMTQAIDKKKSFKRALPCFRLLQLLLPIISLCFFCGGDLQAQSDPGIVVLKTGEGMPLTTATEQVDVLNDGNPAWLRFQFGFGTDEKPAAGSLFDSFSVTFQDVDASNTLAVLTADVGGVFWSPSTPGGITLSSDAIVRTPISFPSIQPVTSLQWAYDVSVSLPLFFKGPVSVYFDLFDNQNTDQSLGWYSAPVSVPEPAPVALYGIAGLLLLIWRRPGVKR